ncbi:MAG: malate synthase A [Candidatus Dormibacteraeota bacterium]|nr:malate synthase A [Candidatus Dormibacteraeota bacterium]
MLSPGGQQFVAALQSRFNPTREELLARRADVRARLLGGGSLDFLPDTEAIRLDDWRVAAAPTDLTDRRVEITGPTDRKMLINALNSGATGFMADFEDSNSPTWDNMIEGQANLRDAISGQISFRSPDGREYRLNESTATLLVRPRGWHLVEKHVLVDGGAMSASLFDFGLFAFHNAAALTARGTNPYFYLPKLESHLEARLWNDVFDFTEAHLGLAEGSIRATVLIETLPAAFEMDEILYELRTHSAGLNAGRWDYMFSAVKTFAAGDGAVLPDRRNLTMTVPFMRAYTELLVRSCHRRGAHAIGGMAALIPNRRDAEATEVALAGVRGDKRREAGDGFDGTWVAHPDLVEVAREEFDRVLESRPNQLERLREDVRVTAADLLDLESAGHEVTEAGVRNNLSVSLRYLTSWLSGSGAVGVFNLMEDVATAEIARSQVWQWLHRHAPLTDGAPVTRELVARLEQEEAAIFAAELQPGSAAVGRLESARALLAGLLDSERFVEFLTYPGYDLIP